jgi:hypothetical protein
MHPGDWLKKPWAVVPARCKRCHLPKLVCAYFGIGRLHWSATCWCDTGTNAVNPSVLWLVSEVRPPLMDASESSGPNVSIWSNGTIPRRMLADVLMDFAMLDKAREIWREKPGSWVLELREDGQLWAPWCPIDTCMGMRKGKPLPYRESRLMASKYPRACVACAKPLTAGDRVWRPHNPNSTVSAAGWVSDAHQAAIVCEACATAAMQRGSPVPGPKPAVHLRLVAED